MVSAAVPATVSAGHCDRRPGYDSALTSWTVIRFTGPNTGTRSANTTQERAAETSVTSHFLPAHERFPLPTSSRRKIVVSSVDSESRTEQRPADRAPSPATATVWPGLSWAQTAAWWPVANTSESVSTERCISSEWPDPGTVTSVVCRPAAPARPRPRPRRGSSERSRRSSTRSCSTDVLDYADELAANRPGSNGESPR